MDTEVPSDQKKTVLDPAKIVPIFNLTCGDHVADFGSGHGYFAISLAHAVCADGKVYAIDIQRPILDVIRAKSKLENLLNVECIWSDLEQPMGSKLKDNFIDFVFIGNALFQAEQKENMLKEAFRILRTDAKLAIIEWDPAEQNPTFGPPQETRIAKEIIMGLCLNQSFILEKEFNAGSHHYGLLFKKTVQ
ncbi:MAG: class I SAM-dependent methyltransferase [Candidatus Sungbacteria bacterium]|nr:class I SAM-dependent methyltransferase [bacterium]MDZ4260613.1 class I SAM-dependent methyltransferase [Candidatus Sungbacteria bacterium]